MVTPRRGTTDLLFLVGDGSGIRSERIAFQEDVEVTDPAVPEEVPARRGRRSFPTGRGYAFRKADGLRSPHVASVEAPLARGTDPGSGRRDEIIVGAVGDAGNRPTRALFPAEGETRPGT